jgi:hypothetical protein
MAMSKDSKYGVFVLEEHTDYTANGQQSRWTAFKVSKGGIEEIHKDRSHDRSRHSGRISISHVHDGGIVLSLKGGKEMKLV